MPRLVRSNISFVFFHTRANDENFSLEERKEWESKMQHIRQESAGRSAYDTLKEFYKTHEDQEVTVLHGYELMDKTDGAA